MTLKKMSEKVNTKKNIFGSQITRKIPVKYKPVLDQDAELALIYEVFNELEWDIKSLRNALKKLKNEL